MAQLRRIDAGDATLLWGDRAQAKAALREESVRRYQALPLGERLRIALSMVTPNTRPDGGRRSRSPRCG